MRLAMDEEDLGHDPDKVFIAAISFNGVEQKGALTADEELGYLLRYKMVDGKHVMVGDDLVTEEVYGKVVITFPTLL